MSVEPIRHPQGNLWIGLSTDTKPARAEIGSKFFETDTGLVFVFRAGEWALFPDHVSSGLTPATVTLTRPADMNLYAAKDAVANATSGATILTFSNVVPAAGRGGYIVAANIHTDQSANTARYKLHLFNPAPTAVIGDNAPMTAPLSEDQANYQGSVQWGAVASETGSSGNAFAQQTSDIEPPFPKAIHCASDRHLYAMLETLDSYTPDSEQAFFLRLLVASQ